MKRTVTKTHNNSRSEPPRRMWWEIDSETVHCLRSSAMILDKVSSVGFQQQLADVQMSSDAGTASEAAVLRIMMMVLI